VSGASKIREDTWAERIKREGGRRERREGRQSKRERKWMITSTFPP